MTTRPALSFNGLNALALRIALFAHGASGVIHMHTVRDVAEEARLSPLLPAALAELEEFDIAEVCTSCDALITVACEGEWCGLHQGKAYKTGHARGCPKAGKAVAAAGVAVEKRERA